MSNLSPIVPQIAKLVRLLATDNDGERQAAVNAIERKLGSVDASFHDLADLIEKPNGNGGLSQDQMQEVYSAGFHDGVMKAENNRFNDNETFRDADGKPSWQTMAKYCLGQVDRLYQESARKFVCDMASRSAGIREYIPSEKQLRWLTSVYYKLGGKP
jgi:hypothetical protein